MRTRLTLCLLAMLAMLAMMFLPACAGEKETGKPTTAATTTQPAAEKNVTVEKTAGGDLTIQPINRSSVRFEFKGKQFYVDPSGDADWDHMPKADYIFVSHEHGDHMDLQAISRILQDHTAIYTSRAGMEAYMKAENKPMGHPFRLIAVGETKKLVMAEGKEDGDPKKPVMVAWEVNDRNRSTFPPIDITVEAVPAYNISEGKLNFHPKDRKDNGYVLTFADKRVYIACDTEATPEMKALKNIDIAFLPCDPRYTMSVEEAVEAAKILNPKIFYPYHQGPSDPAEAKKLLADEENIEVRVFALP